jgi:ArsR family transcriptional regulator, arsenate/arsenite/antimonite-responsive transcriptional repressor
MGNLKRPDYYVQENGRFSSNKTENYERDILLFLSVAQRKVDAIYFSNNSYIMEDDADYTLDKSTIDSLSSNTRIQILSSLKNRRKTNAELAKELSLTSPTIHHHLERLSDAGLIEAQEDGHKWVYYRLTPFGLALSNPEKRVRISIILSAALTFCTALAALVTFFTLPRLDIKPFYPGFDDPFLPMFVIAIGAVVIQVGILVWMMRATRNGDRST